MNRPKCRSCMPCCAPIQVGWDLAQSAGQPSLVSSVRHGPPLVGFTSLSFSLFIWIKGLRSPKMLTRDPQLRAVRGVALVGVLKLQLPLPALLGSFFSNVMYSWWRVGPCGLRP